MIHLMVMLGVVTGYYSGTNYEVKYNTDYGVFIKEDANWYYNYTFELWYQRPGTTSTNLIINSPTISRYVPTNNESTKPYGVVVELEFTTLGTNNVNSYQMDYEIRVNAGYTWYYYDGATIYNTDTYTLNGYLNDYNGDNRLLDRTEYGGRQVKYSVVDNDLLQEYAYSEGRTQGQNEGRAEGNGVNNVISWFGNVWDALTNFLNLEIAPNVKIGGLITIPIVIGALMFALKALIQ